MAEMAAPQLRRPALAERRDSALGLGLALEPGSKSVQSIRIAVDRAETTKGERTDTTDTNTTDTETTDRPTETAETTDRQTDTTRRPAIAPLNAAALSLAMASLPASPAGAEHGHGHGHGHSASLSHGDARLHRKLSAALAPHGPPPPAADTTHAPPATATPATARFPLQSPCYVHQRFDAAVDIARVLDELAAADGLSHSRLLQTATGVREVSRALQRRPLRLAVRAVMLVTKARDHRLVRLTRDLAAWLLATPRYGRDCGVTVYVDAKLRASRRFDAAGLRARDPRFETMLRFWTPDLCWAAPETFDLVVTLGGDGTVLFTSWLFQRVVPPILAFSLGSLGFLTNFDFARHRDHLDRVLGDGGMRVNLRMRFTCTVFRAAARRRGGGGPAPAAEEREQFEVVNELVIDRGPSPYVSNLEVYGDDELLTVVQADGCILSTPTGSTAYSLSAGGSLVHPSIPAILLTPICPHTLSFRPMVLSDTLRLRIAVPAASRASAYCAFDGKGRVEIGPGDFVSVEASPFPFPTVVAGAAEWIESVRRSLCWNARGAVQKAWGAKPHNHDHDHAHDHDDDHPYDEDDDPDQPWDIDTDSYADPAPDSGLGPSECGDSPATGTASPLHRVMSLLNM
ncbi:NAD(+) kinase [Ophidiomyces ophidiicola]|nr:NAD(+) kinase [Ophidiomyces ophidiicola]